jgi:hypothetical protein
LSICLTLSLSLIRGPVINESSRAILRVIRVVSVSRLVISFKPKGGHLNMRTLLVAIVVFCTVFACAEDVNSDVWFFFFFL